MNDDRIYTYEACQAKDAIAEAVLPILIAYRKLLSTESAYSVPNWVKEAREELSLDEMNERWLNHVDKMIQAFSIEIDGTYGYDELEEKEKLQDEGLMLFAKHYGDLWD